MNLLLFCILIAFGASVAGLLGSLTGMGGGIVIVPMLTVLFGVDLHYAMGASLISVIGTSSGTAASYVKDGFSNIRLAIFLEIATTIGAILGAYFVGIIKPEIIIFIFSVLLFYSAITNLIGRNSEMPPHGGGRIAKMFRLNGEYPNLMGEKINYSLIRVPQGFVLMFIAGNLSGLLGIGSGSAKVIAMDQVMKIPYKVSTTTSNLMIGITAAASSGIYLNKGYIDPILVMPVLVGVLFGSFIGVRLLKIVSTRLLRILFSIVVLILAVEMLRGILGSY